MIEDKLIKQSTVLDFVQISKSKMYELIKQKEFPEPIKIGGNSLWKMSDIQEYIQKVVKG